MDSLILLVTFFILLLFNVVYGNTNINFLHLVRNKRETQQLLLDEPSCGDIKVFCSNLSERDDLLVLECLQSLHPNKLASLNEICQRKVWAHTSALIQDDKARDFLLPQCRSDLDQLSCKIENKGGYLACIVTNKDEIQNSDCRQLILRLENVAFTDYRFINGFLQQCTNDIKSLQCGAIDSQNFGQAKTISCLQSNILKVSDDCKREVFKLSELQSDNIKLDRQLYLDCAEDHSRYCSQFIVGSGRVFHCLMRQDQRMLSKKCKQHLLRRERLIVQDYRVSKGLMRACKEEIKKTHCRRQTSSDRTVRLAQILLCLENMVKNGTKIESDCEAELIEHRRMLMEDYRLSPEILDNCKDEISRFCNVLEAEGKTIHCLMKHVMDRESKNLVNAKCQRSLEGLVEQSDAGENWKVDPVLEKACSLVVKSVCNDIRGGDAQVMSCLMDNINTDHMTEDCEDALIQIQYFVSRDFKLDPQLYRECREDAAKHCHISRDWHNEIGPNDNRDVLPCLYRYANHPDRDMQLDKSCLQQIRRVMRQRAISVNLQPEIEEVCLSDLGTFCQNQVRKDEEMQCLQKHLDDLDDRCHDAVHSFTEFEGEHAEVNPYINRYCRKIWETLCSSESKNDEGDIMECLISHKNDPTVKANHACRASIEHFQIVSIKDYKFSYKFKIACKPYAMRFCSHSKTKSEVVHCLSEQVLNATVHGVKSVIPKECKQQLKAQLFQQRENIDFDPVLKAACAKDIDKYCSKIDHGSAQVLECLQSAPEKLSDSCEKQVFKVKKQEVYDNTIDYSLVTMCAGAIEQFCPHHEKESVLECLKMNKDNKGFNKECRMIVMHRMVEQNSNYQLNLGLQQNCIMDINKFCKDIVQSVNGKEANGRVIKCLKEQFRQSKLSNKCEKEMATILRDQALNVELNPLVRAVCKNELSTICKNNGDETGKTEECLKEALLKGRIHTAECAVEVANIIEESQADIEVDPLLQNACALDLLNFCIDVPRGGSRHIQCLQLLLNNSPQKLSPNCKNMLKKRLEMYKNAVQFAPPNDLKQLYIQVSASPAKHYFFLTSFVLLGVILLLGIFLGRVSRPKYALLKNK